MKLLSIVSIVQSLLLLLPSVSAEALPALAPCWRDCFTSFCRQARTTSLLPDTITCIRQSCTAGRPFSSITLLTPFEEHCNDPIPPNIITKANALASEKSASSGRAASSILDNGAQDSAPATPSMTTTFIGIATNADGQQETYTVPAIVGATGTVWGKPVSDDFTTPASTITLPWPTLPVGYFSTASSATVSRATSAPGEQGSESLSGTRAATSTTAVEAESSGTAGSTPSNSPSGDSGGGGTILEASEGTKHGAGSLLGLMVVLTVGVMWF
ncbi:MAG: hypothetical protein Q9219_005896 [cf. Caloplaca sp. 3 TL-2023]